MKEVKITVSGKEYKKTRPTLLDLRRMAEYQQNMQGKTDDGKTIRKNIAVDADAQAATIQFVGDFLGAEIDESADLFDVFEALRTIDANIAEALTGKSTEKNAEGR